MSAQPAYTFWPNSGYDPAVPSMRQVLGYEPGERISSHANLMRYLEALASSQPSRMKMFEYAKSWEGRKLVYAAIASEKNIARLPEIQAAMQKLSDARKISDAEARRLMANLPAVIWLGYGVHGNEISSCDAALLTAYHLLAAKDDPVARKILDNVVVLIDPTQNPDGRDRFVRQYEQNEGLEADPSQAAAEHNEPWPAGRTNHYYFDMNRDWFALTQPETRGRITALRQWFPLVFIDLHEMGSDATYYFTPEALPFNPHLFKDQVDMLPWFGKNNAKYFDQFGFSYFTREVYDAFYPGYGASWPSYYGAVAATYEQASTRGLVVRKSDDTTNTYRDTVRQHFVASMATAETSADHREDLLKGFYRFSQTAVEEGNKEKIREYVIPRRGDTSAVDKLIDNLVFQGVEVKRATAAIGEYPKGTYVIPLAQPAKRLIRTLLDTQVDMEAAFVKEEDYRRKHKLGSEIYDLTGWSLPLLYNVECIARAESTKGAFEPVPANATHEGTVTGKASVAYLAPWGTEASARFLAAALRKDLRVHSTDKGFTQNGRKYPRGTLIIKVKENAASVHDVVAQLAKQSGADVVATDSGWVDDGVNFGSRWVNLIKKPAIAMAWDRPTSAQSAGHTRFVLERQFGYPVTVIRTEQLAMTDLSKFQVIVLPEAFGDYGSVFGPVGGRRIKDWVTAGGTLIAIGRASNYMADPKNALMSFQLENLAKEGAPVAARPAGAPPATPEVRTAGKLIANDKEYEKAIQADTELPDSVHGVLARARIDPDHWITVGVPDTVISLVQGREVYTPVKTDKGTNAAYFESQDKLLASGYLWDEAKKQLAYKPLVVVQKEGRGNLIAFTEDPNFRAYLDSMNVLFLNAVFRGPAHTSGGGRGGEED